MKLAVSSPLRIVPPAADSSPSGVYRLPLLEMGEGERRDECAHYGECLGRFIRLVKPRRGRPAGGAEAPARCPSSCSSFELVPSHVRHGIAHGNISQATPEVL